MSLLQYYVSKYVPLLYITKVEITFSYMQMLLVNSVQIVTYDFFSLSCLYVRLRFLIELRCVECNAACH